MVALLIHGSIAGKTCDEETGGLVERSVSVRSSSKSDISTMYIVALCLVITLTLSYSMIYRREVGVSSSSGSLRASGVALEGVPKTHLEQARVTRCTNDCDSAPEFVANIRASIPLPHDTINGKVPPGIPNGARSDIVSSEWHEGELFVVYLISGRQPGYRTPIHVHPRPQTVCLLSGTVLNIMEGHNDTMYSAGDCYVMPALTKMVNYNIGNVSYTDHDIFRVPAGETDWVVIEPDHLDMQYDEFDQIHSLTGRQVNSGMHVDTASGESLATWAQAKETNLMGLYHYFATVSATGLSKNDKLDGIVQSFANNAVLVRPDGVRLEGHEGVRKFYGNQSPALKLDNFKLHANNNTMSFSEDGATIAVEILMPLPGNKTSPISVFFTFDSSGRIAFKRIYAWPQP